MRNTDGLRVPSMIEDVSSGAFRPSALQAGSIGGLPAIDLRKFAGIAWAWYHAHENDVVYTVRVWIITKKLTWKDLHFVFERVFGSDPGS